MLGGMSGVWKHGGTICTLFPLTFQQFFRMIQRTEMATYVSSWWIISQIALEQGSEWLFRVCLLATV